MKKYVKPEVHFESFTLSQHIADCGWELQSMNETVCHAVGDSDYGYVTDVNAFAVGIVGTCQIQPEGYCYTASGSAVGLFAS